MTLKKSLIHALVSAALAILASIIYNSIYSTALDVNFQGVLNGAGISMSCIFGCVLMGLAYYLGFKWKGAKALGWINIFIALLSFVSIVGVLGFSLPVDMESPELFPGLAIPMHFFPALAFFCVYPFFANKE